MTFVGVTLVGFSTASAPFALFCGTLVVDLVFTSSLQNPRPLFATGFKSDCNQTVQALYDRVQRYFFEDAFPDCRVDSGQVTKT